MRLSLRLNPIVNFSSFDIPELAEIQFKLTRVRRTHNQIARFKTMLSTFGRVVLLGSRLRGSDKLFVV